MRTLKRLLGLLGLGAIGYTVYKRTTARSPEPATSGAAQWTPLEPAKSVSAARPVVAAKAAPASDGQSWIPPVEGACPDSHPIKANADSMIFHVPGGRSYATTRAERCYCEGADAVSDGFRAAKR